MNRASVVVGLCAAACAGGIALGWLTCHSIVCRDAIGVGFGRGHLLALMDEEGIYEVDVERGIEELRYSKGQDDVGPADFDTRRTVLTRLMATAALKRLGKNEASLKTQIDRESDLVRSQFHDRHVWTKALTANRSSDRSLRSDIAGNMRVRKWIEQKVADATRELGRDECVEYFNVHQQLYVLPARFRASHLFLAAPTETPAPIVDLKRRTIDSLSVRLSHGEDFSELVGLTSEDEATKMSGGNLGFFSAVRMPPDFFSAIGKMPAGEISPPIQTRLGFHIVRLTDFRPSRQMNFREAEGEIRLKLENGKRREATQRLLNEKVATARFVRFSL